jgi:DICT domain-containing protein/signal transduction histidine kinase
MNQSTSLLQDLIKALPHVKAQIYFKNALTALSHAMEDLVLVGTDRPLVIANFQQERFYRQETRRYQKIAQCTDQVYVLAAPETDFASVPAPYATIGLDPADQLAQEWHLVIIGSNYSACLICREYAAPVDAVALDSARQFRGFWNFDPEVSRQAAVMLLQRITRYRPDLASQVNQAREQYQLAVPRLTENSGMTLSELDVRLFSERLVTYLQASQFKQVKAYRRIVKQEQQGRLINRITAAVRQSLKPEDVLAVTLQEVARVFSQCRCFLYRMPGASGPIPSSSYEMVEFDEYEVTTPTLPSLLGQGWHLATHPQFQPLLQENQTIAIADITQDSGIQAHVSLQHQLAQAKIQACLLLPIYYQQRCLAVLELHQPTPHLWSLSDRALLAAIADQVGLVLMQAESYMNMTQLNQQLAAIEQSQNNLIAIVGHELRTPLSTIQVCLESMAEEPNMPPEYQQVMLDTALEDSERLRKLIQDFLLLSRLESNQVTWQLEPIDLSESISLAMSHLQKTARSKNVPTIVLELPSDLPPVLADGEALLQLLNKLIDNACKFTPVGGAITATVSLIKPILVDPTKSELMVEVKIADTGCGIASNQIDVIFERFYQAEGFLQRSVGGTGLGLAICRQLTRRLGGKIWVTSQGKGQGSEFHFTLPVFMG